jgi:hypothetical protein
VDLSVGKTTKLFDRIAAQFQVEVFNLINHANLSLPAIDFASGTFGTVTRETRHDGG